MTKKQEEYRNLYGQQLGSVIGSKYLLESVRTKNLLCWLSAKLDEGPDFVRAGNNERWKTFFEREIDIEHIQAFNPEEDREIIQNEWKDVIHSIGNLLLLERNLNRSISNGKFSHKIAGYRRSMFRTVRFLAESNADETWTVEKAEQRKEREGAKLLDYLLSSKS